VLGLAVVRCGLSVSWCLVPDAQVATASRFMAEDSMDSEDISVMSGGSSMSDTPPSSR
jgi:hypothetical protein